MAFRKLSNWSNVSQSYELSRDTEDGGELIIKVNVDRISVVDSGIGSYEYQGQKGIDSRIEIEDWEGEAYRFDNDEVVELTDDEHETILNRVNEDQLWQGLGEKEYDPEKDL